MYLENKKLDMISTFGAFLFVVLSKNEATVCLQYFCNYNYKLRVNATRFHLVDFVFYKVFSLHQRRGWISKSCLFKIIVSD